MSDIADRFKFVGLSEGESWGEGVASLPHFFGHVFILEHSLDSCWKAAAGNKRRIIKQQ